MKGLSLEMGFAEFMAFQEEEVGSSAARDSFQWGGTIFALSVTLNFTLYVLFLLLF